MGCLDPMVNKERTFELLRKKGVVRAELEFNGGHDEGGVESITLYDANGEGTDFLVWYTGGYGIGERRADGGFEYVRMNEWKNEDEELSELLQGPVDAEFGTWASVESTSGMLVWDVEAGTVRMDYSQDEPREHSQVW